MPYLPKSHSRPGGCCPSSRPRPTLEAPQDVRSASRTHRAQLPEPSIMSTGHGSDRPCCRRSAPELPQPVPAAAQIRAQERAQDARSRPGGCCPSSRPRPTLEAARTCAARPGRTARHCRSPRSRAPATDQTGHVAADPRRSTPPEARKGPQEQKEPKTRFYIPTHARTRQARL